MTPLTLGLATFGDVAPGTGGAEMGRALRDVVEQGVLADRVGVDHFVIGEHHRGDFAVSTPEVVLSAIAARTDRIRLGSGVTVLSSDDPVRVYERFATLDGVSGGRAEIQVGRGSFAEPFALFGYDLADYVVLFDEKLDLLARLRAEQPVTWRGRTRAPLSGQRAYPTTERGTIPVWVGVGGTTESVVRTARYGLPMMLAILSGPAERFRTFVDMFHAASRTQGTGDRLAVGVHSPGFVADTDELAREQMYTHLAADDERIGAVTGLGELTRDQFDAEADAGSLYVGAPETVARRIADTVRALGVDRFDLKYANGPQPHGQLMRAVELFGTVVAPRVRELLA